MDEDYMRKTTVAEQTNHTDSDKEVLDEQVRPVPTMTYGANERPQEGSMTGSKAVPFVVTALIIIAVIILAVWLW